MAMLAQRTRSLEERTDRLESIIVTFSQEAAQDREESAREREESAKFREEMALQGAQEREESARFRKEMALQAAQDREASARFFQEWQRKADRDHEKYDRYFAEAARERREMNKRWGELANKMGTVVEDIVAPSVRRLAREVFGCGELQYFSERVSLKRSDDGSREREFDALYVGTRAVLLNETKSSPRAEDARKFAEFHCPAESSRSTFREFRELPVVPVFSSLSIPAHLVTYLTRRGIYALAMGDEAMQVLNLEAVRGS